MPPRTTPRDQDPGRDAEVVEMDSVVDLDLDEASQDGEDYPPFRVRVGGQMFCLEQPDAGLVMELGSANSIQTLMALLFDEQWPDVRPLLAGKKPEVLFTLARQHGQHFDLDEQGILAKTVQNRAERRRRRPRRRG